MVPTAPLSPAPLHHDVLTEAAAAGGKDRLFVSRSADAIPSCWAHIHNAIRTWKRDNMQLQRYASQHPHKNRPVVVLLGNAWSLSLSPCNKDRPDRHHMVPLCTKLKAVLLMQTASWVGLPSRRASSTSAPNWFCSLVSPHSVHSRCLRSHLPTGKLRGRMRACSASVKHARHAVHVECKRIRTSCSLKSPGASACF